MATTRSAAVIVVVSLALAGCSGFPIDRSTRAPESTPSVSTSPGVTSSPSATPTVDPGFTADGALVLTPTSVGDLTIDDTAADVASVTGRDYSADLAAFGGDCADFTLTDVGPYRHVSAIATSGGAGGHIDVYAYDTGLTPDDPPARTAEGIGIGSTEDDIVRAYPGTLTYKPSYNDPENQQIFFVNGAEGMAFTVNADHLVIGWAVGRVEQLDDVEGCA